MRSSGDGGEDHQVAGADHVLGAGVDGDVAGCGRGFQVAAEPSSTVRRHVVHPDLVEGPPGRGEECVHVAGDQSDADETDAAGSRRLRLSQSAADAARAAVRVALMIDASRQANG